MGNISNYTYDPNILTVAKINKEFSQIHKYLGFLLANGGGGGGGVSSFNTRTGAVTLSQSDVTTALGGSTLPGSGTREVVANPDGTIFTTLNSTGTDLVVGREYIFAFHKKIYNGLVPVVTLSGDSTTAGVGVQNPNYLLQNLLTNVTQKIYSPGITVFNDGVSSTTTADWLATQLPGTLARNPDLMIIRWGINDAALGATTFQNNLRTGLAEIRAQGDVTKITIILMAPNSTNDTPNGRDATWYELINPIIRQAAKDFLCVYIDTYHLFNDSTDANDLLWMTNDFGDGRHIHPADVENIWITSQILDIMYPITLKTLLEPSSQITNVGSATRLPATTDATSTYPSGISLYRGTAAKGWPNDGMVTTFNNPDGVWFQINNSYLTDAAAFRTGQGSGWGNFISLNTITNLSSVAFTAHASDAQSTYPLNLSVYRATPANGWMYDGIVTTLHHVDGVWLQINSAYQTGQAAFRTAGPTGGWSSFLPLGIDRLTNTQRDAISSPPEGLTIYSLTDHTLEFFNGTVWKQVATV